MIKWIGQTNSVTYGFRVMKAKSQKRKKSGTTSCACQLTAHFDVPLTRWFNWTWWFNWTLFSLVWFERAGRSTAIANSDSRHRTVDTERYSTVQYSTVQYIQTRRLLWKLERKLGYLQKQTRDGWKWNKNIPFDNVRSTLILDYSDIIN